MEQQQRLTAPHTVGGIISFGLRVLNLVILQSKVGVTNQAPVPTRLRPLSHCVIGASPGALGSKSCSGETFVDDARS